MTKCVACGGQTKISFRYKNYTFLVCTTCTLSFIDPQFIPKDYTRQYRQNLNYLQYYSVTKKQDQIASGGIISLLSKFYKTPGKLIEIGCSTGNFLDTAQNSGWKVSAVEPNKSAFQLLKKLLPKAQLYNNFLDNKFTKVHKKKYDVVFSSHVIEHTKSPKDFLLNCKKLLKKNGLLIIITPDFANRISRFFQIKPTEHLVYLNKTSSVALFQSSGLRIINMKNASRPKNLKALPLSTTFTNQPILLGAVKIINAVQLHWIFEYACKLFRDDLLIVAKNA